MTASKKITVVLDSNIIISALLTDGAARRFILHLIQSRVQITLSTYIIKEVSVYFASHQLYDQSTIRRLIHHLQANCQVIAVPHTLSTHLVSDPKDNPILLTVIKAKADYLITGDKALLNLRHLSTTKIVTISQYFKEIGN